MFVEFLPNPAIPHFAMRLITFDDLFSLCPWVMYYYLQLDFSTFQTEGEDELKKRQLMELAIMNGTYRDSQSKNSSRKSFIDYQTYWKYLLFDSRLRHLPLDTLLKLQYPSLFDEFLSQPMFFASALLTFPRKTKMSYLMGSRGILHTLHSILILDFQKVRRRQVALSV